MYTVEKCLKVSWAPIIMTKGESWDEVLSCYYIRPLQPFPPTLNKRDAAYDYLKYWITIKGWSA